MKRLLSLLLFVLLSQSCTVYKGKPVALEDAYDKGEAKVVLVDGTKLEFDNLIIKVDGVSYGKKSFRIKDESGKKIPNYVKLPADIESIYLKNPGLSFLIGVGVIAGVLFVVSLIAYSTL